MVGGADTVAEIDDIFNDAVERLDATVAIDDQGLLADRPAVTRVKPGFYWWSTDRRALSRSDGSAWFDIATSADLTTAIVAEAAARAAADTANSSADAAEAAARAAADAAESAARSAADANNPTANEKAALAGTSGAPGAGNAYVTTRDPRNSDQRTPTDASVSVAKTGMGTSGLAQEAFRAYKTRATAFPVNVDTACVFDSESFDVSARHDSSTGRYTPQVAGIYRISALVYLDPFNGRKISLFKNGVMYAVLSMSYDDSSTAAGSTIVQLNGTTDYVQVFVQPVGGSGSVTNQINELCWWGGELVGRV